MPNKINHASVSPLPIKRDEVKLLNKEDGAEVMFLGIVREIEDGKQILGIDYQCYEEMTEASLQHLEQESNQYFPKHTFFIQHRIGFVAAGEPSVIIAVTAKHSSDAFEICQYLLARIKKEVPIWKHPVFT
jgi:molybdopterin synthase catalytic subunit